MRPADPSKPLLFVAMPFGNREEPNGLRTVDFDRIYADCIRPAAERAGVAVIRADEEAIGGIIHRPMYERLLLAEIVVADLTFANPNVFYELGVRHAARPRSTILTYARVGALPFDVAPVRAVPYALDDSGGLVDATALRDELSERLQLAKSDGAPDSPLFQLLDGYSGVSLSGEATEAFRERALWVSDLTVRARALGTATDASTARAALAELEREASALAEVEDQLLLTLVLAYRSLEAWDDIVRVADSLPATLKSIVTIREQLALALSRRNGPGDRARAIEVTEHLMAEHGESSETLGLLGRCHKARWLEKAAAGDAGAEDALAAAIDAYERGFGADPRDFYPGINLVTLMVCRGTPDDIERASELAPVVAFALARRGGLQSRDYWTLATVLELSAIRGHESDGRRALSAMLDIEHDSWMPGTTADNLTLLTDALPRLGVATEWVSDVIALLRGARPGDPIADV